MRVRGFCCGWIGMDLGGIIKGEAGQVRLPVPSYVIEHRGSILVFDAGLHPDLRDEDSERYAALSPDFDCDLPPGTAIDERLQACDIDPADVDFLVLSHLHFDHVGGRELLPGAELVVQRTEWEAALADLNGETYLAADVATALPRRLLDGEWDVFGDGRARLISTVGHTAGHQSLLLTTDAGGELLLCGDACYTRRSLEDLALPPSGHDLDGQRQVLEELGRLQSSGARLIFGHEPAQWPTGAGDDRIVQLSSASGS